MISYFSELRYKEVIDVNSGFRLGYACDMEFDDAEGRIVSLVTPGRAKFFGLLGREDDYVLPWQSIVRIGSDILQGRSLPPQAPPAQPDLIFLLANRRFCDILRYTNIFKHIQRKNSNGKH